MKDIIAKGLVNLVRKFSILRVYQNFIIFCHKTAQKISSFCSSTHRFDPFDEMLRRPAVCWIQDSRVLCPSVPRM
jgi:hypothetical protein